MEAGAQIIERLAARRAILLVLTNQALELLGNQAAD